MCWGLDSRHMVWNITLITTIENLNFTSQKTISVINGSCRKNVLKSHLIWSKMVREGFLEEIMSKPRLDAGKGIGHIKQHGEGSRFHQRQQDVESLRDKRDHRNPQIERKLICLESRIWWGDLVEIREKAHSGGYWTQANAAGHHPKATRKKRGGLSKGIW